MVVLTDEVAVGHVGADIIELQLEAKPETVLGLAAGSTPLPVYRELVRRHRQNELSFRHTTAFLLDEYLGLGREDPRSFHHLVGEQLVCKVDLAPDRFHTLDGRTQDWALECARFETDIASAGGVDLQLVGIGSTGHLAFNEPGSSFNSRTRKAELTPQTRHDNARFFDHPAEVPCYALTQGLATIMDATRIVLVAFGASKARAVSAALQGAISPAVPASVLQCHPHVTALLDVTAATQLHWSS